MGTKKSPISDNSASMGKGNTRARWVRWWSTRWRSLASLASVNKALLKGNSECKIAQQELLQSRAFFQTVIDAIPDAVMVVDLDHRVLLANRCARKLARTEDLAADRLKCYQVSHHRQTPCDAEKDPCPLRQVVATGAPVTVMHTHYDADGHERIVEVSAAPVFDESGKVVRVIESCRDITERKKAGEALNAERQRLHDVLEAMPIMVCLLTPDYRVAFANRAFREKFGESHGRHCYEYCFGKKEPCDFCETYRVLRTGRPHHWQVTASDGASLIDVYDFPFTDVDGSPMILEMDIDITERKKTEEALRESEARYKALFAGAPEGILVADLQTKQFRYANPAICRMFGYTEEEFLRLSVADIHPKESLDHVLAEFEAQVLGEKLLSPDLPCLRKDGTIFFANISAIMIVLGGRKCNLGFFTDVTERRHAQQEAWDLGKFPMENPSPVLRIAADGKVIFANPGSQALLEAWRCGVGRRLPEPWPERVAEALRSGVVRIAEAKCGKRLLSIRIVPVVGAGYVNLYGLDITEQRIAEEQLRQAQKMEAIGQLAGGVAHDFRNQLTVIKGYGEMLLRRSLVKDAGKEPLEHILKAADRSTTVAGQLLAFSRQQTLRPEVVRVNSLTGDMMKSLAQALGEDIRLSIMPCGDLWNIRVDTGQFQQALLNLVLNARDAMPQGGQLTIETENIVLDQDFVRGHVGASAGRYVVLTVGDTGVGMNPETLDRVFEPFFTTKPAGEGTGLGLAMVHGFVAQSGGFIEVKSHPRQPAGHGTPAAPGGTTFRLYFPAVEDVAESAQRASQATDLPRGSGTVLVVEDEDAIRRILLETLGECGYTVLTTGNAQEAMALMESAKEKIDLLITDVVMPGWSGPKLVKHFQAARPGVPVLLISGHTGKMLTEHGVIPPDVNLLVKPFSSQTLVQTVRKVLGRPKRP